MYGRLRLLAFAMIAAHIASPAMALQVPDAINRPSIADEVVRIRAQPKATSRDVNFENLAQLIEHCDVRPTTTDDIAALRHLEKDRDHDVARQARKTLDLLRNHDCAGIPARRRVVIADEVAKVEASPDQDSAPLSELSYDIENGFTQPPTTTDIDALAGLMQFPSGEIKLFTAVVLWRLGPVAKPAIPALERAIADSPPLPGRFKGPRAEIQICGALRALGDDPMPAKCQGWLPYASRTLD